MCEEDYELRKSQAQMFWPMRRKFDPKRDWPEDFKHENGMYVRRCCNCGLDFVGHKRRVVCGVCGGK